MKRRDENTRGFTVLEVLVAVAIIAVLATLGLGSYLRAKEKSKETAAKADISALRDAILLLEDHTEKWPNGCPTTAIANPEVNLDTTQAGIVEQPNIGNQGSGCVWTANDIANWRGPYMKEGQTDPWGNPYWFDPDYTPYQNCATKTTQAEGVFIISFGPNGVGLNQYDCDDMFLKLL